MPRNAIVPTLRLLTSVANIAFLAAASCASPYSVIPIVTSTDLGAALPTCFPALNNSGAIAFRFSSANGAAMLEANAGPLTTIVPASAGFLLSDPAINDNGVVAFEGEKLGVSRGIYSGSGGPLTTIAVGAGPFSPGAGPSYGMPSITSAGTVTFYIENNGFFNNGINESGVYTGNGGSLTTVRHISQFFNGIADPAVSNNGQYISYEWLDDQSSHYKLYRTSPGATDTIWPDGRPFHPIYDLSAKDLGTVAWIVGSGGADGVIIYGSSGGAISTLADTSDQYTGFSNVAINNQGKVVFAAIGGTFRGIYSGPSRTLDKIAEIGDTLGGSTIIDLHFDRHGLNEAGQVAFWAKLADGRSGIYLASPVPEPGLFAQAILVLWSVAISSRRFRR
jgi:hypothetical protein